VQKRSVEKPGGVSVERINAIGGVVAAAGVAEQGPKTGRRIFPFRSVMIERFETKAAVPDAAGQTNERPIAISGVGLRLRLGQKPKAGKH
jgi:hypothetical protein